MKHKYIRELFPDQLPFPYDEKDYHGFDERDTFSMDHILIMWLYERLRFFQDEASKVVNFDFGLCSGGAYNYNVITLKNEIEYV